MSFLQSQDIELVADVRAHPGSRRSPQFGSEAMSGWLDAAGIGYLHLPELGGRRPRQDVEPRINAGWRNASFKNYADYTLLPGYEAGIERLVELASTRRVAVMCGEPTPWRCHRLLISNTLAARGWTVCHIIDDEEPQAHELGRWGAPAEVEAGARVTYPDVARSARET